MSAPKKPRFGVQGGGSDTSRLPGLTGFVIRAMPTPVYKGKGKARRIDPTKPPRLKLVGYYTKGSTPNWSRLKEYEAWKDHVRKFAPPLPEPSAARPVRVDVWCYFESGTHCDPENCRKGIVDALFPGGDKWVFGYHHYPRYSDAPHVLVEISEVQL